jgi:hypothetical protein
MLSIAEEIRYSKVTEHCAQFEDLEGSIISAWEDNIEMGLYKNSV